MTPRVCGGLAIAALFVSNAVAQTPLKGTFILAAEGVAAGQPYTSLGALTLDGAGNLTGTEVLKNGGAAVTVSVKGTYTMTSPNSGTLSLTFPLPDDDSGATATENYRFYAAKDGALSAIRTDPGVFAVATISPLPAVSSTKGSFVFSEFGRAGTQPYAIAGVITFDGNGAATGSAIVDSGAASTSVALSGTYAATGSIVSLSLMAVSDSADDAPQTLNYRLAATGLNTFSAIRADPGVVATAGLNAR